MSEKPDARIEAATSEARGGPPELPEGWSAASIEDVATIHDNIRVPLNAKQRSEIPGEYPYYGANGLVDHVGEYLFDGEYVLLAEDGGYFDDPRRGVAYRASGKFWVNNHAHILKPAADVAPDFINYWLNAINWMPHVGGTTRLKLTQTGMRQATVPVPPLAEQRRIVAKLDRLSAKRSAAEDHLARISKLAARAKQSILAAAFRGDLTADRRLNARPAKVCTDASGVDGRAPDLGDLPTEWAWASVGSVAAVSGGLTKNRKREELPLRAPYLRVANVYANELRLNEILEIGCSADEIAKTTLLPGDLLVVEGNGSRDQIGRVAMWQGAVDGCLHQNHLIRVRPDDESYGAYLLFWMLSPGGREAIEAVASSSSGLHTLNISKVKGLPVPVCSTEEQAEIVRRIEAAFARIDRLTEEASRASHLLARLDECLLAKAFRGELVPQDPTDEPASTLLTRIRTQRAAAPKRRRKART